MHREKQNFVETVWEYYAHHARGDLPWRQPEPDGSFNPYKIVVSEIMLQQTQVARVIPKYQAFLDQFPDVKSLALASLGDVLRLWQGLGYNRRAKYLWQTAQKIEQEYDGIFPQHQEELITLPGIGPNTGAAIRCYAFSQSQPFIETNIRTVYIHHFFADMSDVDDKQIWPVIQETWDDEHSREWGWALMDYGSYLKSVAGNASRQSKHYVKQAVFAGSKRQLRGWVLRELMIAPRSYNWMFEQNPDERLLPVVDELESEGLIYGQNNSYRLA